MYSGRRKSLPFQQRQAGPLQHRALSQPHQPHVAQAKVNAALPAKKLPVTPAPYRPQPVPRVLQSKKANHGPVVNSPGRAPVAPAPYRPNAVPRVLQTKLATGQRFPTAPSIRQPPARQTQQVHLKNTVQRRKAFPHPNVGSRPAGPRQAIQLYSTGNIPPLKASGQISANENYILVYDDVLYIKSTATVPAGFVRDRDVSIDEFDYNGARYSAYKFDGLFLKDCLHTAEELINQKYLDYGKGTYSKVKGIKRVFGQSEDKNVEYALKEKHEGHRVDEQANPGVNEAYVIIGTTGRGKYPYHGAAVVAKDGNDTVTLEVSAGYTDAQDRDTAGELCMYEIGGNKSFHSTHKGDHNDPVTIVIVPK